MKHETKRALIVISNQLESLANVIEAGNPTPANVARLAANDLRALACSDDETFTGSDKPDDYQVGGDHYKNMGVQPWTALDAWLPHEQFVGYLRGTAVGYLARAGAKGDDLEDYEKGAHTLAKLIETLRNERA
jgi:hypothetical protein